MLTLGIKRSPHIFWRTWGLMLLHCPLPISLINAFLRTYPLLKNLPLQTVLSSFSLEITFLLLHVQAICLIYRLLRVHILYSVIKEILVTEVFKLLFSDSGARQGRNVLYSQSNGKSFDPSPAYTIYPPCVFGKLTTSFWPWVSMTVQL